MQQLAAARRWLSQRGYSSKVDLDASPPVPMYEVTSVHGLVKADGIFALARRMGWRP